MDVIAGYRVIRELGGGARSTVLLAHDAEERSVVLRLLDSDAVNDGGGAIVDALSRSLHPALLPLVDFAVLDDGRVLLVHPRVAGGTLGELIARRGRLDPGEATAVVDAIGGALRALHAAGWAHNSLGPDAVLLSLAGHPVLAGPTDLAPLDVGSMVGDAESFRGLAISLVDAATAAELGALPASSALVADVEAVLRRRAAPALVRLSAVAPLPEATDVVPRGLAGIGAVGTVRSRIPVLADLVAHDGPVIEALERGLRALRRVRRPVWGAAVGVALALIAAAVLIPQRGGPAEAAPGADASPVVTSTPAVPDEEPDETRGQQNTGGAAALTGDDPLAATLELVARRQRCLDARSVECMDTVTQEGSAARSDGLAAIEAIESGETTPEPLLFDDEAPLVQRTGGSAIVTGGGVSVLIVKGESGWRVRDVFDSPKPG